MQEVQKKKWFWVTIDVEEVKPIQKYHDVLSSKNIEYVLVYTPQGGKTPHTVYVKEYDSSNKIVTCINSHGTSNPNPQLAVQDINNLYQVTCSAVEASQISIDNGKKA